jgi:hypothetical protein
MSVVRGVLGSGGGVAQRGPREERMAEVDVDRIKAQVAAARAARPQEPLLSRIGRWEILSNEHAAALLRSHLEKTGFDLQALERAGGPESPPTPLQPSPKAAQAHARRMVQAAKVRRGQVQAARAAAKRDDRTLPLLPPADIVQPAFVWATPAGILVQDNLAPDDNWAQVEFKGTGDLGWGGVGFFYIWTNPSQDAIGLSVDSLMGLVGSCSATAKRGYTGGHAHLLVATFLNVYEAGASDVLSVARNDVVEMSVDSFGFWLESQSKSASVDALIDLSYEHLVVPGGGTIVVEAAAGFVYNGFNGEEVFDFAGNFSRVTSPNMTFTPKPIIIT